MNLETKEEQKEIVGCKKRSIRQVLNDFWQQDTDTVIYTLMCIVTVPALALGIWYLKVVQVGIEMELPEKIPSCIFQLLFGAYCPGCGGTRAFSELFKGNILMAVYYNPGGVYGAVLYVVYFVSQTLMRLSKGKIKGMKLRPIYLYVMLAVILLNCIIRNVLLFGFGIDTL